MDGQDLGRAEGEDGALDGARCAVSARSAATSLCTSSVRAVRAVISPPPPVAAPLQRTRGPCPGLLDQGTGLAIGVVEHHGLAPAGNGRTDRTGVRHLAAVRGAGDLDLTETGRPPRRSSLWENVGSPTVRTSTSDSGLASPRAWLPKRTAAASAPSPASSCAASSATASAGSEGDRPAALPGCVSRRSGLRRPRACQRSGRRGSCPTWRLRRASGGPCRGSRPRALR